MKKVRWNWSIWLGFFLSIVAFPSYFLVFAKFPVTRNIPWANFLLFGAGAAFLVEGWKRVLGGAQPFREKIVGSILVFLSISIFGAFCFVIFHTTRQLPDSLGSPNIGQNAPEFTLRDTHGNLVSLSSLLSTPLDPPSPSRRTPRGVLLVFYRGYW